jgi:hypothetical protein
VCVFGCLGVFWCSFWVGFWLSESLRGVFTPARNGRLQALPVDGEGVAVPPPSTGKVEVGAKSASDPLTNAQKWDIIEAGIEREAEKTKQTQQSTPTGVWSENMQKLSCNENTIREVGTMRRTYAGLHVALVHLKPRPWEEPEF